MIVYRGIPAVCAIQLTVESVWRYILSGADVLKVQIKDSSNRVIISRDYKPQDVDKSDKTVRFLLSAQDTVTFKADEKYYISAFFEGKECLSPQLIEVREIKGKFKSIPPIMLYGLMENYFSNNGFVALCPTLAEAEIYKQQAHTLHLEHPIDSGGAWKRLGIGMILNVPIIEHGVIRFQPMRIYRMEKKRAPGDMPIISVDARHLFYDMNGTILTYAKPENVNCLDAIEHLRSVVFRPSDGMQATDWFYLNSDIEDIKTVSYSYKTFTAALIGEPNSIVNVYDGQLYVNGMYFSINRKREGSLEHAFDLRYNMNMSGITATYSGDNVASTVIASSNIVQGYFYNHVPHESVQLKQDKTIITSFRYDENVSADQFHSDLRKFAADSHKVSASYNVSLVDLYKIDGFDDFNNLSFFEVGDTGKIFDEDLGIETEQEIISKKIDVLTQETISVTFGESLESIVGIRKYNNVTIGGY